jgi:hypothetical protein
MKSSYSTLMQSKYFSPAFNSAIFDGPVRIYFAQFHEAIALKLYFMIQQKLSKEIVHAKEISKASGANILVMIYPTIDSYAMSFDGCSEQLLAVEEWNDDMVIGTRGPIEDDQLDSLVNTLRETILNWKPASLVEGPVSTYIPQPEL